MWVQKLSVVMDLSSEVGVVLLCGFEHHLDNVILCLFEIASETLFYPGAIDELMRRKINFAKRSLAYEAAQCIVPNGS